VAVNDRQTFERIEFASGDTGYATNPDDLLNLFRHHLARLVPFISIPSNMRVETLSRERPFFYRAIIDVVSYHDSVHQIALYQELLNDLMEHLLILGGKNRPASRASGVYFFVCSLSLYQYLALR
jgi:hypothetical protein